MGITHIDGHLLKKMIIAGANRLEANKQLVDSLNVFPVPDGDTGTNMSLTTHAAAREAAKLNTISVFEVAKAAAGGSLRGARGNSGVILSQLFRGLSKALEGKTLSNCDDFADALDKAVETAYKAVMKPKEGTILTVGRAIADRVGETALDTDDIEEILAEAIRAGSEMLVKTTQMLPQLKQANVVDAGGKGLLLILEGAYEAISSKNAVTLQESQEDTAEGSYPGMTFISAEDITYGYCTEFIINDCKITQADEEELKRFLNGIGDSIVVVNDDDLCKIHVHTNHPGSVIEKALTYGYLSNLKIDNMRLQHTSLIDYGNAEAAAACPAETVQKEYGFVTVASGDGFKDLFLSLEADKVIEGGQTMNPSTEDFLLAINEINARHIIILPNNKNIIWAAKQAAELCQDTDVHVLETRSVPQGLAAMINFMADKGLDDNLAQMNDAMWQVNSGHVTYAVRDSSFGGKEIKQGDTLGMYNGDIAIVSDDIEKGARELIDKMASEGEPELISIYYGQDATPESAEALKEYVSLKYPDFEAEVYEGGQPLYYYIISAE